MPTRRDVLKTAGKTAAVLTTTAPWWLSRKAHAKQAGIKENEIDYQIIGGPQLVPKLVASLEAGNPPDITRLIGGYAPLYRSQGHLLEVTDLVNKMQKQAGGLFPISLPGVMHQGKAWAVPQSVSPWTMVTRMDLLEAAKVEHPKTGTGSSKACR